MKEKFMKFMEGRYGVDQFARFTLGLALVTIVLSAFFRSGSGIGAVLDTIGLLALVYTYFRMFSRDISKRSAENQKYLTTVEKLKRRFKSEKNLMKQRKDYHIYSCPNCGQKIRMPRGKGKVEISCPKCHNKFIKKA